MSVEDVIEANARVLSPALEAALVEAGGKFSLDSRTLKQLADAGVSPSVIDVMVAQAYPDRFRIERPPTYQSGYPVTTEHHIWRLSDDHRIDPYIRLRCTTRATTATTIRRSRIRTTGTQATIHTVIATAIGSNYNTYYFGYPGGSYYIPGNRGARPIPPPGSPDSPGGSGVVVNGRGYTRVRPAGSGEGGDSTTPTPRTPTTGTRSRAAATGSAASSGTASSSSSGTAPSAGDSSGSSSEPAASDSGRRTAQPLGSGKGFASATP